MSTPFTILELSLAAALVAALALCRHLWRRHVRSLRKVTFLFNAIDNGDYAFKFPEEQASDNERLFNQALNRVKQILEHARDEQKEREKYFELILDSVDTGILVVDDERGIVLRHNRAALRLLHRDTVSHINQIKELLPAFSIRTSHTMLQGHRVAIMALSDIKGELANQEMDSWVKLIRVLTHEIMNTVTPIISLSDTLLRQSQQGELHDGLDVINRTSKELVSFVENYRQFARVPSPQPSLFYAEPFLTRMMKLTRPLLFPDAHMHLHVEPHDFISVCRRRPPGTRGEQPAEKRGRSH